MVPPTPKETLLLYISTSTQVVSAVLVAERPKEGQPYPVQRPVYYVSEVLSVSKIRYSQPQKMLYTLLITSRKHQYYFQSHKIKVLSGFPLGEILHSCHTTGCIINWSVKLGEFELEFYPRYAIKSQILAYFISEWTETQQPPPTESLEGAGAGVLFISLQGDHLKYILQIHYKASNNGSEYEALIHGLRIAVSLGIKQLIAYGDSNVVIVQVNKACDIKKDSMNAYCAEV
jgi:hypothetical protein